MNRALFGGVMAAACIAATQAAAQTPPPAKPPAKPPESAVSGLTVSGAKKEVETSIDRRSYSVANDLQAKTGTMADVLRNVPSVQVDVQGNVSLRGDGNVTVLVDGKPSSMFTKDTLAQALQNLPADQVDRIEVMTNPSAEFRADGSAGIINLVMKKAKGGGRTGSLRVNGGTNGFYGASLSNGYNSNKISTVQSLAYQRVDVDVTSDGLNTRPETPPATGFITQTTGVQGTVDLDVVSGRAAIDYDATAKTRLTASVTGSWQGGAQIFDDSTTQVNGAGATTLDFDRHSIQDMANQSLQLDLNLRRKDGDVSDLTLHATIADTKVRSDRVDDLGVVIAPPGLLDLQTDRHLDLQRSSLQADYSRPLDNGIQLKAGYLAEYFDNGLHVRGGTGATVAAITPDPTQTDDFAETELHNQAYVTLQKKFGNLTALGGLRGEAVNLDFDQQTLGLTSGQDYTRLYPTLHLSYGLGEGRTVTASYSKRVSRPGISDFDPFPISVGPGTISQGNPNLQPQETNAYEVSFERRKGPAFLLTTFYYRQTDNAFSIVLTDLGNGTWLQRRQNLGHQINAGAEVVYNNRFSPKLSYNLSVNGYWTEVSAPSLGFTSDRSAFTAYGRANLNWQVTPKDFVQLNVFANGKGLIPQGYSSAVVSGNIGYRHNISDKLSWMLVVQDPFKTQKQTLVLDTPTIKDRRIQRQDSQAISLSLVWNFAGKPRDTGFDFTPGGMPGSVSAP